MTEREKHEQMKAQYLAEKEIEKQIQGSKFNNKHMMSVAILVLAVILFASYQFYQSKNNKFFYTITRIGKTDSEIIHNATCHTESGNYICILETGEEVRVKSYSIR